jgi:hypothetical protein
VSKTLADILADDTVDPEKQAQIAEVMAVSSLQPEMLLVDAAGSLHFATRPLLVMLFDAFEKGTHNE